jgi:succinoglycan biosynthesis protein ExoA
VNSTLKKRPLVSVVIPCWNEQATIIKVLDSITQQSYPLDLTEVIIVDGLSTDGTREEVEKFFNSGSGISVKMIDNPRKTIPSALNLGINAATGEIILRLDAHSFPSQDYIEKSVIDLLAGKGANVGGIWKIKPGGDGWIPRSIALAASNRLGVGDAYYRVGASEGAVDTVPFGIFYKETALKLGGFDESLLTNEDYEFNVRIRKSGGVIWLDPAIQSEYVARRNWRELSQQYWRYGYWKNRMLRMHPGTLRWRQALPPLFMILIFLLSLLSIGSEYARFILALVCGIYLVSLILASISSAASQKDMKLILGIPISIATMHFCWGAGFLFGFLKTPERAGNT